MEERIQAIAYEAFSGEMQIHLWSPSESTRTALLFGNWATKVSTQTQPKVTWLQQQWQEKVQDACPVCSVRPQGLPGSKAGKRKLCEICEERRADRSKIWISQLETTIWIDEVADRRGQIALIVARFEMSDWLNSSDFNTIFSFDPQKRPLKRWEKNEDGSKKEIPFEFDLRVLTSDIKEGLDQKKDFEDNLLGQLVSDKNTRGSSNSVEGFYDLRIEGTDLENAPGLSKPERLTLSLMRQQPSFARIRRTWETTREFWEAIKSDFKQSELIGEVDTRIKLRGKFVSRSDTHSLAITHTYELKLGNMRMSITCTQENTFLSVENLQRFAILSGDPKESVIDHTAAARYIISSMQSRDGALRAFVIEEPTGYGSSNKQLGILEVTELSLEQRFHYVPAIKILTEPQTFIALVPADKALKVAQHIKEKYEVEMGKVRNRLPMALGIVFADRRTPLPAILDAGRRMPKQPLQAKQWAVGEKDGTTDPTKVELTLERNDSTLKLQIPVVMGDGTTEDAWYPYWCVESDKNGNQPEKRKRQFTSIEGKQWIHVSDLARGDTVYLCPSRFDFELLDTAARRFEVSYAGGKRRGGMRPARPYYLEQLDSFEQLWELLSRHLAISQIANLIGLIETKRQEWLIQQDDDVFQQAVKDILHSANWQGEPLSCSEFEQLARAAVSGQLSDVVELFITILKEKTRVDLIGGTK